MAQPLLDVLGRSPEFFVAHETRLPELLACLACLLGAPALVAAVLLSLVPRGCPRVARVVTAGLIGLAVVPLGAQVAYRAGFSTWPPSVAAAAVAGLVAGGLWKAFRGVRQVARVLVAALVVVPVLFLARPEIRAAVPLEVSPRTSTTATGRNAPTVVMLVFDELPLVSLLDGQGQLNVARFPHVAALARDGIWFRRASTVSDYTRWALPALLSGSYPRRETVPTSAGVSRSLFTWLAPTHAVVAEEPLTAICPAALTGQMLPSIGARLGGLMQDIGVVAAHVWLPPAARGGLPAIDERWAGFGDAEDFLGKWHRHRANTDRDVALRFIDGIARAGARPTLYFMHSMVTHHHPRLLPTGQGVFDVTPPPGLEAGMVWSTASWPVQVYHQAHLAQAAFVDTIVGRLVERLRSVGIYDQTLVVITADHGAAYRPGERMRDLTASNAGEIAAVPLIIKLPAGRPVRPAGLIDDRNVESVDVLPTLADALGVSLPWPVDGVSALSPGRVSRTTKRVWYDQHRKIRHLHPDEFWRQVREADARTARTQGSRAWPAPVPEGLPSWMNAPIGRLPLAQPVVGGRVTLRNPFALDDVDPAADLLPVLVEGRVEVPDRDLSTVELAVALNGTIAALTRTWVADGVFRVMLPPERLRPGRNGLEVFLVTSGTSPALAALPYASALPRGIDLLFDASDGYGLAYDGFHHVERDRDERFHWTDGAASIRVPVDPRRPYRSMTVTVRASAAPGMSLRIRANACEVARPTLPDGAWSQSFDLTPCAVTGRWMTLRFDSPTHQPGGRDRRRLGVALTRVVLH